MTSPTGPNAKRRTDGFTLLELIVVLVLISTLLALAAPSLRRFAHGRKASDTATHLLALTHLARTQAATQARPYRLNIDLREATYWLTVQEAGAFVAPEREYGRLFRLPDGVTVSVQMAETLDRTLDDETPYVEFYPDGRSDVASIELNDAEGRALRIECPSASERFRIVSPTDEIES